jgi:ankyrin repeat protein
MSRYDVDELMEKGSLKEIADILHTGNRPSRKMLEDMLRMGCLHNRLEAVRWILDMGVDVNTRGDEDWTPLMYAGRGGDAQITGYLLDNNADIHARNNYGRTALHEAVVSGDFEVVHELVNRGADINVNARVGGTPLAVAAWNNRREIAAYLIESGADVSIKIEGQDSILRWAAGKGYAEIVITLVESGKCSDELEEAGSTLLIPAVYGGEKQIVESLLDHGCNVDMADKDGNTPLMAAVNKSLEMVKLLVENNADLEMHDRYGMTALGMVARAGKLDVVKYLIENGATYQPLNEFMCSPLCEASWAGHVNIVQHLLELDGMDINYRSRSYDGATAIMNASIMGRTGIVEMLLREGEDPYKKDKTGKSFIHYAARGGSVPVLQIIGEHDLDLNEGDNAGITPVMVGVMENKYDAVVWLAKAGADIYRTSDNGLSAFIQSFTHERLKIARYFLDNHTREQDYEDQYGEAFISAVSDGLYDDRYQPPKSAAKDSMTEILFTLLEMGVNPDVRDSYEVPALQHAVSLRCPEVVKKMVEHGADVNAAGRSGWTPLKSALHRNNPKIINLLLKNGADPL